MFVRRVLIFSSTVLALILPGCSSAPELTGEFRAKFEPWRGAEEKSCLVSGSVQPTLYLQERAALGGPSQCGTVHPFEMSAADDGRVKLSPPALLRCPMIPQVDRWVKKSVRRAAFEHFGVPVTEIVVAGSYSCRAMNHVFGGRLSEHGYANAIDISGFKLADGRKVTVRGGWRGDPAEQAFLRDVHSGGCQEFTTVLGPNYDRNHHDHLHFDLARHGRDGLKGICR